MEWKAVSWPTIFFSSRERDFLLADTGFNRGSFNGSRGFDFNFRRFSRDKLHSRRTRSKRHMALTHARSLARSRHFRTFRTFSRCWEARIFSAAIPHDRKLNFYGNARWQTARQRRWIFYNYLTTTRWSTFVSLASCGSVFVPKQTSVVSDFLFFTLKTWKNKKKKVENTHVCGVFSHWKFSTFASFLHLQIF